MTLTNRELQTLRNLGNESEAAADEITRLTAELDSLRVDAERWRFLSEHWHSLMGGIQLHRWVEEQALRRGGMTAALDYAMNYHYSSERHIADVQQMQEAAA